MFEELFETDERAEPTSHAKIKRVIGLNPLGPDDFARRLERLDASLGQSNSAVLASQLKELVPTYRPTTECSRSSTYPNKP